MVELEKPARIQKIRAGFLLFSPAVSGIADVDAITFRNTSLDELIA